MADYDNTNRGALFKNDNKEQDNHPDYKGSINVNGVEYWISSWLKTSDKTGKKFMSLSVKQKEDAPRQVSQPTRQAPAGKSVQDMESDIPW